MKQIHVVRHVLLVCFMPYWHLGYHNKLLSVYVGIPTYTFRLRRRNAGTQSVDFLEFMLISVVKRSS